MQPMQNLEPPSQNKPPCRSDKLRAQTLQTLTHPKMAGSCIVVMGVCAAGKSSTAKEIAKRLSGYRFVDADPFHSTKNRAKINSGVPLEDNERAKFVKKLVSYVARRCAAGDNLVLAWSALRKEHRDALRQAVPRCTFIYLELPQEVAQQRAQERRLKDPKQAHPGIVPNQYQALEIPKRAITISAQQSVEEVVQQAVNALSRLGFTSAAS